MCRVFTLRDTFELLCLGALIVLISIAGSVFLNFISIFMVGLYVSFGNRVKNLSDKFVEIDKANKEVNDAKKKS